MSKKIDTRTLHAFARQAMARSAPFSDAELFAAMVNDPRYRQLRADAATAFYFPDQLASVRAQSFRKEYPGLKMRGLFPDFSPNIPRGAEVHKWRMIDDTGKPAYLSPDNPGDVPKVSIKRGESEQKIYSFGFGMDWDVTDLDRAAMTGEPINPEKARAVTDLNERAIDELLALGDADTDLSGAWSYSGVTATAAPSASTWAAATAADIVDDLLALELKITQDTLGVRSPTVAVLSFTNYSEAKAKRFVDGDQNTNPIDSFLSRATSVRRVEWDHRLDGAGGGGTHRNVMFQDVPEVAGKIITINPEWQPVFQIGSLAWEQIQIFRLGGIVVRNFDAYQYQDVPSS
jgi:hypothetical protein